MGSGVAPHRPLQVADRCVELGVLGGADDQRLDRVLGHLGADLRGTGRRRALFGVERTGILKAP